VISGKEKKKKSSDREEYARIAGQRELKTDLGRT